MKSKILSFLLAFSLLAGGLFAFLPHLPGIRAQAAATEAVPPKTHGAKATPRLLALLERVEALEKATAEYYGTENTFDYVVRYIRSRRYADFTWQLMVGSPDPDYVKAMSEFDDLRQLSEVKLLEGDGYAYVLDFPHMCAAADAKLDFAGWAGDLITLASDIGSLYEARLLLAGAEGYFNLADYHADIDARNLYALSLQNGGSLSKAMRAYYTEGGINTAATDFLLRDMQTLPENLSIKTIYEHFHELLCGETAQSQTTLLAGIYGVEKDERLHYAAQAFAEELFHLFCGESHGHQTVTLSKYAPTCKNYGYTLKMCLCCEDTWEEDILPKSEHEYHRLLYQPTEDYPGIRVDYCKGCGIREKTLFDDQLPGDLNINGKINLVDYVLMKRSILGTFELNARQLFLSDLNKDGEADALDCILLRHMILNPT